VILILVTDVLRHVDELDLRFPVECGEEGLRQINPITGSPGADVKEAVCGRSLGKMDGHGHGILHIDEVAYLLAVLVIGTVALEEADFAGFLNLLEGLRNKAAHLPLVTFVGAKDIKVFDADNPTFTLEPAVALRMQVEEVF